MTDRMLMKTRNWVPKLSARKIRGQSGGGKASINGYLLSNVPEKAL